MRNVISNSFSVSAQKPTVSVDHIDNYYIVEATGVQPAVDDSRWQLVPAGGTIPMPTPAAPYLWHKTVTWLTDGTHLAPVVEFAGSMGQNGIDYDLVPSHSSILKDANDNLSPANVTCALVKRNADGSADAQSSIPTGYSIKVQKDNNTASNYTLGSNVSTSNCSVIVFSLWYGSVEIERHTISVVVEGAQGVDGRGIQSQDYRFKANDTGVMPAAPISEAQWNTWKALNATGYSENVPYCWRCCKTVYVDGHGNTETVYLVDGPTVWGKSGKDIYLLDLDNEMDAIPADSTGKTLAQVVLTTNYRLYKGPDNITAQSTQPTAANIKIAGITPTITASSDYVQIQWTIPANTTLSADRYAATIPVGFNGETYRAVFTANVVKSGQPGVSPEIYQLLLSCTEASFARNASNQLTPSYVDVRCGYTKTVGETVEKHVGSSQAELMNIANKYNIFYRAIAADGTAGSWAWMKDLSSNNFYLRIQSSTTNVAYEFALSTASGTSSIADSNIIDRETLPINKDGLNGAQGESAFTIDLDNEQDAFGTDSEGKIGASLSRETTVAMFYGLTPLELTGISTTKKYEDNTNCGSEVAVTTDATTGKVTVTLGSTTFAYTKTIFIDITATSARGSKSARFTLQPQAGGAPGVTPTIYQLEPIPNALAFSRNASDVLTPSSQSVTPSVKRTVGNETDILSSLSGYRVYYGWDNAATPSSYKNVGTDISVTNTNAASHYNLVLELWQMNGNTKVKRVDRETVPINKDGLKGAPGDPGDTPFIADIDNEMTSIPISQAGKVETEQNLSFNVSAFYGQQNVIDACQSVDLVNSEGTVISAPSGFTINTTAKSTVTIKIAVNTQPAEITELRFRVVHADYGTRYFTYSIAAVKSGGKGQDAVLYELLPSASEIAVGRNTDGTYNPATASLTCGYKKIVGTVISIYDDVTGAFDGYNIYFRRYNRSTGQWSNYLRYTYYKSYLTNFDIATYSKFEFIICTNTATSVAASSVTGLIDKETVPVVADGQQGKDGVNAITIDLDNECDAFGTDPSGKISAQVERTTKVSMFNGITPLTLTAIETSKTYEDGTSCGSEVTVEKNVETGQITVKLTSTSYNYTKTINIGITATTASGSRTVVFTLQPQASGTAGVSPVIYQLSLKPSALTFARNASNGLVAQNNTLYFYAKKTEGNETVILTSLSGYYIKWGWDGSTTVQGNNISIGTTRIVTTTEAANHTSLWVELWKTGASQCADRETVPIHKDGLKGDPGDDGVTPFVVDIDNEMTSIPISQEGKVTSQIQLSFNIGAYYGQTNVINDSACSVALVGTAPSGFTIDTATSKSNPRITIAANTQPAEITELKFRVSHTSYGDRDAVFSIAAVKSGGQGQDAVLYELLPSASEIAVGRNTDGTYNPATASLTCGYKKIVGTVISIYDDVTGAFDGYNIYFRRYNRSTGQWSNYLRYTYYKSYLTNFDIATYSKFEFIICTNTATSVAASSVTGLIDKETVPVVADGQQGKDGVNAITIDLDNECDAFGTDPSGKISAQVERTTKVSMFNGITPLTLTAIETSKTYEDGTSCGSEVTVEKNVETGQITVKLTSTSYNYTKTINIGITATTASGSRTVVFTLQPQASGTAGVSPVIYQLSLKPSALTFARNASNGLVAQNNTLYFYAKKTEGNETVILTSLSGYYIKWGWDGSTTVQGNNISIGTTRIVTTTEAANHTSLWVELWKTGASQCADRETVPIHKDGLKGDPGDDGVTPFVVDIDNEMTSIPISQEGKVTSQIQLSFNIGAYYGQTNVINDSACSVALVGTAPSGFTIDTATSKSNPRITIAANTQPAEITELKFRVSHTSYGDRDAVFSIAAVKSGGQGQDAVLYELLPSDTQIAVARTDAGGYNPSTVNLTCGYIKKAGTSAPTTVTDATGAVDGYSIYFRRYSRSGSWSSFMNYVTYKSYLQGLDVATYSKVQFILCRNTGSYFTNESSITGLIDKETVPIVADGTKGKDGKDCFVLDIDNEMAAIPVNSSGKVEGTLSLDFGLTAFYGTTAVTGDCSISVDGTLPSGFTVDLGTPTNPSVSIANNTQPAEVTEITFKAVHATYGTRYAVFTICAVKSGGKGADAELYQLAPSESAMKFARNSSGSLTGSYSITCKIRKTVGSNATEYSSLNGYYIYYGWDGAASPSSNFSSSVSVGTYEASNHTSLVLELWRGQRTVSGSVRLDRETIPILKDGEKGGDGDQGNGIANVYFYRMFTVNLVEPASNDSGWILKGNSNYPTEEGLSNENHYLWEKKLTSYTRSDDPTIEISLIAQFVDGIHENLLEDTAFLSEGEMEAWETKNGTIGKNSVGSHNSFGNTPVWENIYTEMLQQRVYKYGEVQKLKPNTWYTLSFYAAMQAYQNLLSSSVYNGSDGGSYWAIGASLCGFWLGAGQQAIVTVTGRCYSTQVFLRVFGYEENWESGLTSSVDFTSTSSTTKSFLVRNTSSSNKYFCIQGYVYINDGSSNPAQNTYSDQNHRCYITLIRVDRGCKMATYLYRSDNGQTVQHSASAPWYVDGKKYTAATRIDNPSGGRNVTVVNGVRVTLSNGNYFTIRNRVSATLGNGSAITLLAGTILIFGSTDISLSDNSFYTIGSISVTLSGDTIVELQNGTTTTISDGTTINIAGNTQISLTSGSSAKLSDNSKVIFYSSGAQVNVQNGTDIGFADDGNVYWQLNAGTNRHYVTFKTPSSLSTTAQYRVLFRLVAYSHYGWVSMPKLEEGTVATDWIEASKDRTAEEIQHVFVGDWVSGTTYYYGGGTGVRHVVRAKESYNGAKTYFRMKVRTTSSGYVSTAEPYNDSAHWEKASYLKFTATDFLLAENAVINFAQTNRILVTNSSGVVAAGLGGAEGGNEDYPLWVGATYANRANAPFRVNLQGKMFATGCVISGDSIFEGTLRGVTGSFKSLNCVNESGTITGAIRFGSDGNLWLEGDLFANGTKDNRSYRFYTADIWCRGHFASRQRLTLVVCGSYGYYFPKGLPSTWDVSNAVYVSFSSVTSNNKTYYRIPCYSPDGYSALAGMPVDTVLFRITLNTTYRYYFGLAVSQRIVVANINDEQNNVIICCNGSDITWNGGEINFVQNMGYGMIYPAKASNVIGGGHVVGAFRDNDWR